MHEVQNAGMQNAWNTNAECIIDIMGRSCGWTETPVPWDGRPPNHWCRLMSSGRRNHRLSQPSLRALCVAWRLLSTGSGQSLPLLS